MLKPTDFIELEVTARSIADEIPVIEAVVLDYWNGIMEKPLLVYWCSTRFDPELLTKFFSPYAKVGPYQEGRNIITRKQHIKDYVGAAYADKEGELKCLSCVRVLYHNTVHNNSATKAFQDEVKKAIELEVG